MAGFSGIGSSMVRNYTMLSQNQRAQEVHDSGENLRDLKSMQAGTQIDVENINNVMNDTKYGNKYGYAMELKNQNDQDRALKIAEQELKLQRMAATTNNISKTASDASSIQVGLRGDQKSLEDMARATSGQGKPSPTGYSSIGPVNVKYIQPQNMTAAQVASMDRIKQNRSDRVADGIYGEETFTDGVKRYVNKASNEVFGQDIWLEDENRPGEIYTPEHLKMITGQPARASEMHQATTPQAEAPAEQPSAQPVEQPSAQPAEQLSAQPAPSTKQLSEDGYDLSEENVKKYKDYASANPDFHDAFVDARELSGNAKEGTALSSINGMLGKHGPETDAQLMKMAETYPDEIANMSEDEFKTFYKKETTAAPTTKTEAKAIAKEEVKTEGQTRRELVDYVDALTKQSAHNANIGKGAMKPSDKEEFFMNQTNNPDTITKALEAGVQTPKELHDFIENKGKFKAPSAKEKSDLERRKESSAMDDKVFDKEGKFSLSNLSKLTDRDTSTMQRRHAKNTDLRDDQKEYAGHENWFKSRDAIIELSNSRYSAEKLGESGETFIKKYIGDSAGEKDVAKLHGRLTALLGSTVADQIKILSGTAASDKERANILRFMFGDPMVSSDAFIGAMQGRSKFVMNKLPNAAERVYNKNGYNLARKMAALHEKYKDEGDEVYQPKPTDSDTEFVTPDGVRYPKKMSDSYIRSLSKEDREKIRTDLKRRKESK